MKRREVILKAVVMIAIVAIWLSAAPVNADLILTDNPDIVGYRQGIPETLSNAPGYAWWYGCSPTSAGMMMGYYDINGYDGHTYNNLVAGGAAEPETFVGPPTGWSALANNTIASSGHVAAFYNDDSDPDSDPYMDSGDDLTRDSSAFNCLADFMGTSQDSVGNPNGSTTFWTWNNGAPMTAADIYGLGASYWNSDGMYGIGEYVDYASYDTTTLYTQRTDNLGLTYGFSFDDYMAEIDAGRVVMLHVEGHSMFGYGYEESGDLDIVYLHDTWTLGQKSMYWGGAYSGLGMWGVTVMELTGGAVVPVPAAVLLGILGLGVVGIKLRRFA